MGIIHDVARWLEWRKVARILRGLLVLVPLGLALTNTWFIHVAPGQIKVELSNYWIYSRKNEDVKGTEDYALFESITLPLTFYNPGSRQGVVRMLWLEVWKDGELDDVYQANALYRTFNPSEIEQWNREGYYNNIPLAARSFAVKMVEFYPDKWEKEAKNWTDRDEFSFEDRTEYELRLFMERKTGAIRTWEWGREKENCDYLGSIFVWTWDVSTMQVSKGEADAVVY